MTIYQWAVIGAGPAGIATVGKLIDNGISAEHILWIDPEFKVGDFGMLWRHVPSNTKVKLFIQFLEASPAFGYDQCKVKFPLHDLPHNETCELHYMADPLQWVTDQLITKVNIAKTKVQHLTYHHNHWLLKTTKENFTANNVVLAIGSEPKLLDLEIPKIPLQFAMDKVNIRNQVTHGDTVAVFGSSHSAILVLRNLVEFGVKRIINFYRTPLRYAIYHDTWILFDDTGLKGTTADWARENIDGVLPANLERHEASEENLLKYLPQCNKAIYAIGFERRQLPQIEDLKQVDYVEQVGIIAPGLFGVGIAFPEAKHNPLGMLEYRVGLWKFMEYLERVVPIWLKYKGEEKSP